MLQHPETEQAVECARPKRHRKNVSLHDENVAARAIRCIVRIDRVAEIERYDGRSGISRLLGEATRTAADLENSLAMLFARPMRLLEKALLGDIESGVAVVLRACVLGPFEPKSRRIILARHKAGHAADYRILGFTSHTTKRAVEHSLVADRARRAHPMQVAVAARACQQLQMLRIQLARPRAVFDGHAHPAKQDPSRQVFLGPQRELQEFPQQKAAIAPTRAMLLQSRIQARAIDMKSADEIRIEERCTRKAVERMRRLAIGIGQIGRQRIPGAKNIDRGVDQVDH